MDSCLNALVEDCHKMAVEKGWWIDGRSIPEALVLIHSEVSEAVEEFRNPSRTVNVIYYQNSNKPEGFPIELADILIRVFDLAGRFNIDLDQAVNIKMAYNDTRTFRHGGKRI